MGFLKFLKREKKKEALEDLDLPPEPPKSDTFDENMEFKLPDFSQEDISAQKEELPKFELPEQEESMPSLGEEKMPDFPDFPEMGDSQKFQIPPISADMPPMQPQPLMQDEPTMPFIPQTTHMPELEQESSIKEDGPSVIPKETQPKSSKRVFQEERIIKSGKTIYIRVDKFKSVLGNINIVRNDLRKSEDALMKLESIKNAKDKSFDKVRASLDNLQKKLIYVDKTLFKGE